MQSIFISKYWANPGRAGLKQALKLQTRAAAALAGPREQKQKQNLGGVKERMRTTKKRGGGRLIQNAEDSSSLLSRRRAH